MPYTLQTQATKYQTLLFLNSNHPYQTSNNLSNFGQVLAAGVKKQIVGSSKNLSQLHDFLNNCKHNNEYAFGYFSYDVKNQIEKLRSVNKDSINFYDFYFFVPQLLEFSKPNELLIDTSPNLYYKHAKSVALKSRVTKKQYLNAVESIKKHIIEGDVYELNYCIEFYAELAEIDPVQVYLLLNQKSPTPFSAYLKQQHLHLMCASPERFIKKKGDTIYSQPIKGTIARAETAAEDNTQKNKLLHNEKERAENLMIVDLVRNDLAKSCKTGTIKVDELFGIYSFKKVHHMISTVSGNVLPNMHPLDIITNAFPMGSMTGAPKVMAMQLIDLYEKTKRGLYSGAIGYFAPSGDFDFNVVIRSLQYNAENKYLNTMVGSAITFDSIAEEEYKECLLKMQAMMETLL